jgi:hypothetical protein
MTPSATQVLLSVVKELLLTVEDLENRINHIELRGVKRKKVLLPVTKSKSKHLRLVLDLLCLFSEGLTDEEGQELLEIEGNSYRPGRTALVAQGLVYDTGARRATNHEKPAAVWAVTNKGRETLSLLKGLK